MVQILSDPGNTPHEIIEKTVDDPHLNFKQAKALAKEIAQQNDKNAMILSWKNGKTGEFYPTRECGTQKKPAWIYYAQVRGANLTININNGEYIFMILTLEDL
ncbi:AF1514 family protein [uncultured Desulfobacter sp.]|uniref:AF1514 family protein n=1 Tax=uncultured Desulfobacter sp. TaxID=240139 RepID=UPI002AA76F42|nr:AF1514 family protein [uncultured Desulfobacter sp.]